MSTYVVPGTEGQIRNTTLPSGDMCVAAHQAGRWNRWSLTCAGGSASTTLATAAGLSLGARSTV